MPSGVYKHTENQRIKNRNSHLGKKQTKETIQKRFLWQKGYKHSEETKRKISEAHKGKKKPWAIPPYFEGKNHWNWKGGITSENNKLRNSIEYFIWRDEVYKRDYWTCRLCGYEGDYIVAHHLKLFSDFPELRFSIDNGVTLCRSCHNKVHRKICLIQF